MFGIIEILVFWVLLLILLFKKVIIDVWWWCLLLISISVLLEGRLCKFVGWISDVVLLIGFWWMLKDGIEFFSSLSILVLLFLFSFLLLMILIGIGELLIEWGVEWVLIIVIFFIFLLIFVFLVVFFVVIIDLDINRFVVVVVKVNLIVCCSVLFLNFILIFLVRIVMIRLLILNWCK